MLTAAYDFLRRRQRTALVLGGAVAGGWYAVRWATSKLTSMAVEAGRRASDRQNLTRRFELCEQDAHFTLCALVPLLGTQLGAECDVERASARLAGLAAEQKAREVRLQQEQEERERLALADKRREERAANKAPDELQHNDEDPKDEELVIDAAPEKKQQEARQQLDPSAPAFVPGGASSPSLATTATTTTTTTHSPPPEHDDAHAATNGSAPEAAAPANGDTGEMEQRVLTKETREREASKAEEQSSESEIPGANGHSSEQSQEKQEDERLPTKAELWHEIKLLSFTRTLTALYCLALLALETHVQLALLGRASYVHSLLAAPAATSPEDGPTLENGEAAHKASDQDDDDGADEEGERRRENNERVYMALSWWFLHRGWRAIHARVRDAVESVVAPMSLKAELSLEDLTELLEQIKLKVDVDDAGRPFDFAAAAFPPDDDAVALSLREATSASSTSAPSPGTDPSSAEGTTPRSGVSRAVQDLADETRDVLASADARAVLSLCVARLSRVLMRQVAASWPGGAPASALPPRGAREGQGGGGATLTSLDDTRVRLASILPRLTRLSSLVLPRSALQTSEHGGGGGGEYVQVLGDTGELRELAAILFASFDEDDLAACAL